MIQNISQLFDTLMDAVDEINSHFSIQVSNFCLSLQIFNCKQFSLDYPGIHISSFVGNFHNLICRFGACI